jgi:hypothetical protein
MRVLLDECVPQPLKGLKNGELIEHTAWEKFDVLLTTAVRSA